MFKDNLKLKKTIIILLVIILIFTSIVYYNNHILDNTRTNKFINYKIENFFVNNEQYNAFINSIEGKNLLNAINNINNDLDSLTIVNTKPSDYRDLIEEKKFKIKEIVKDNYKSLFQSQF